MTGAEFIQAHLARLAYLDGYQEGLNGMLAVAFAIRNRVRAGWWNGDWISVLSHHRDYSYKVEPYSDALPDPRIWSVQNLLQEIPGIFDGSRRDDITISRSTILGHPAPPVLYYAQLDKITREEFMLDITRQPTLHPRLAQVGQLFFFG